MKLLVTGGAGFIGSNFTRHWVERHPEDEVVVFDALTYAGNRANLAAVENTITFVHGDICEAGSVRAAMEAHAIDVVVHFAAESHNSLAAIEPGRFFRTNVLGTATLLEAARRHGARFHHVSTCEVYGDMSLEDPGAFNEESPYRPNSPYSASKAGSDLAVRAYAETYGLSTTISNCSNNYGPFQFPEKIVSLFIVRALDDQPLPLYSSTHHQREWLHVADHCRAIEAVLCSGRPGETYHVGSGEEANIDQIADLVLGALGKPASLKQIVPERPAHDRRYLLDSSKIHRELGWTPTVPLSQGIEETARWYAEHRSWWRPLLDRAPVSEETWSEVRAAAPAVHR
jgi:dTDP-glucose 4,6-dehydratase